MYDLIPDDVQTAVIESARTVAKRLAEAADPAEAWAAISRSDLIGIGIPDDLGGAGFGVAEEVLSLIELGAVLVDPAIISSMLAAHHLALVPEDQARLGTTLASVLDGSTRVALVEPWSWGAPGERWRMVLPTGSQSPRLAAAASLGGIGLEAAPGAAPSVSIDQQIGIAELDGAFETSTATADLLLRGLLLVGALQVGIARTALERGVEHARVREQFGSPIGSFQAVKHQLARVAVDLEAAQATLAQAAVSLDAGLVDDEIVRTVAIVADRCAVNAVRTVIQVHGGVGVTAEAGLHLLLRRTHLLEQLLGAPEYHEEQVLVAAAAGRRSNDPVIA